MLVAVVALVAVQGSAGVVPARPDGLAIDRRTQLESKVLVELNRVRAARGLEALHATRGLRSAAVSHSRAMLTRGFFAHESIDGTPFHDRIRKHYPARGWELWAVGETLLASGETTDARSIVAAWLVSKPHRQVVLAEDWREAGVGAFFEAKAPGRFGGEATLVVTADFGVRSGRRHPARLSP